MKKQNDNKKICYDERKINGIWFSLRCVLLLLLLLMLYCTLRSFSPWQEMRSWSKCENVM